MGTTKTILRKNRAEISDKNRFRYTLVMVKSEKILLDRLSEKLQIGRPAVIIKALELLNNTEK